MLFRYGSGQQRIDGNAGESMAISIVMEMQWYDAGRIARWITSRASLEATGDAAFGQVLALYCPGGHHGWSKNSNQHTKHQQNTTFSYRK